MNSTIASSNNPIRAATPTRPDGSTLTSLWALYLLTVRQHIHGRRWMVMGALFLLPAGLAVLVRATSDHDLPSVALEFLLAFLFIPQAILPLAALLYASGIIQDEQEEQTITYLLMRPIPKWGIYLVKMLAAMTTTVALTVVFTALTYAAIHVNAEIATPDVTLRCLKAAAIHSLAIIAYCSLFGLLSLLTKRILVYGIIYIVVVEGLLANLPFGIRLVTVIYYARLIAYRTLNFEAVMPNGQTEDLAAAAWQLDVRNDPELLEHPLFSTCVMVLIIASLVCTVVAAWICTWREFHVKTPEKE